MAGRNETRLPMKPKRRVVFSEQEENESVNENKRETESEFVFLKQKRGGA